MILFKMSQKTTKYHKKLLKELTAGLKELIVSKSKQGE